MNYYKADTIDSQNKTLRHFYLFCLMYCQKLFFIFQLLIPVLTIWIFTTPISLISLQKYFLTLFICSSSFHPIFFPLINIYMLDQSSSFQNSPTLDRKVHAITPCTAEGLTPSAISPSPSDTPLYANGSLFSSISHVNQAKFFGKIILPYDQIEKNQKVGEEILECDFKIKFCLESQQKQGKITFLKRVSNEIRQGELSSLIFKNQHEKIQCGVQKYDLKISLQTESGFERKIWENQIQVQKQEQKSKFYKLKDQQKQFTLNFEIQNLHSDWIRLLGLQIPTKQIQLFYEERFELLNKSERLNFIESLNVIKGLIFELSQQNMGSRIIQKLLCKATTQELDLLIKEVSWRISEIIVDKYGNYVIQKLFKVSNCEQKKQCLKYLEKNIVDLVLSKAGTFGLQGILDTLDKQDLGSIVEAITPRISEIALNQFGTHFLQKLIKLYRGKKLTDILLDITHILGVDKHGIVVLKSLLKSKSSNPNLRYQILGNFQINFEDLAFSEFGHYLIQELFNHYNCYQLQNLLQYLCSHVERLSLNQFSSSILKKCIESCGDFIAIPMIQTLISCGVKQLMENNSGTFMLNRFLEMTKSDQDKSLLLQEMFQNIQKINCYEKKQRWKKFFSIV